MNKTRFTPILCILIAIGTLCSAILLAFRVSAEIKSDKVSFAILYSSIQTLSGEDGRTEREWMTDMLDAGISHMVVTDADSKAEALAKELGFKIARAGENARPGDSFISPLLEEDNVIRNKKYTGDSTVPAAIIENPFRTDVLMPDDFDIDSFEVPTVKTMYMYNSYSYHYQFKEPATENENILFRGIVERGMRLIIFTPLVNEQKQIVTDPYAYKDIISGLTNRLASRGITVGEEFSTLDAPRFNPLLFAGALLLLVAAVIYFISFFIKLSFKNELVLAILGTLVAFGGSFVLPGFMQKYTTFAVSLIFAFFEAFLLYSITDRKIKLFNSGTLAVRFICALAFCVIIGLSGGLYISALLANRSYMLGFSIFAGVKISQLAPVGFAGILFAYVLFNKKAREENKNANNLPLPLLIAGAVLVLVALVVLVLRSGDNMLPVADIEVKFRNWLEFVLYVRPRTKEMFVAFPAIALFIAATHKRYPILQLPLAALACLGSASIINTFCHIFTPVHVSVIRTLLGAAVGLVIGMIAMYLFSFILGKQKEN